LGAHFQVSDQRIVLLGELGEELGGSSWLALRRGLEAGVPPSVDLAHEGKLHQLLATAARDGLASCAHDVSDGGLAVALAEACFGDNAQGAQVQLNAAGRPEGVLFGESAGRVIVATDRLEELMGAAQALGVPASPIGTTGGANLAVASTGGELWIDRPVAGLRKIWSNGIESRLENDG